MDLRDRINKLMLSMCMFPNSGRQMLHQVWQHCASQVSEMHAHRQRHDRRAAQDHDGWSFHGARHYRTSASVPNPIARQTITAPDSRPTALAACGRVRSTTRAALPTTT